LNNVALISLDHKRNYSQSFKTKGVKETKYNLSLNPLDLNTMPENALGKLIAFTGINQINRISRNFSKNLEFPAHMKIPDGFKFVDRFVSDETNKLVQLTKKGHCSCNATNLQITVVDRNKDKALKSIIEEYKQLVPLWKESYQELAQKYPYTYKGHGVTSRYLKEDYYLAEKTMEFVHSFAEEIDNDEYKLLNEKFGGKESYLGDIIMSGLAVCRHEACLNKILLDEIGIKSSINHGCILELNSRNILNSDVQGHSWNIVHLKSGEALFDPANQQSFYLDNRYQAYQSYCYRNNDYTPALPINKIFLNTFDLQPGQTIKIGLDSKGELIPIKADDNRKHVLEIEWTEDNMFEIRKVDKKIEVTCFDTPLEDKIVVYNKPSTLVINDKELEFNPDLIRNEFLHKFKQAVVTILTRKSEINLNKKLTNDDLVKANPELSKRSLELLDNPAFASLFKYYNLKL